MKDINLFFYFTFLVLSLNHKRTLGLFTKESLDISTHNSSHLFYGSDSIKNGNLINFSTNFSLVKGIAAVKPFRVAPFQEPITTPPPNYYATLDIASDVTGFWKASATTIKKWFEYYHNTTDLRNNGSECSKCAHTISGSANELVEKQGIWVACQDPTLDFSCQMVPPCYPKLTFQTTGSVPISRTVKINLALRGLATVRLTVEASGSAQRPSCFDFSARRDPFTPCTFIKVDNTGDMQWKQVKSTFDAYDNADFSSFTVQLVSRFKNDVALVDKIEGLENLLCDDNGNICTTTPAGTPPSISTTTFYPSTPTTTSTTTKCSASTTSAKLKGVGEVTRVTFLDTIHDVGAACENSDNWEIPEENLKWLEYYDDSYALISHIPNTSTCANVYSSSFLRLPDVEGIWSNCQNEDVDIHPFITFHAPEGHFINYVEVNLFLKDHALLRLHVGGECIDYSAMRDDSSSCRFMETEEEPLNWTTIWIYNQKLANFRIQLVSKYAGDVLLIDRVVVEYRECDDDECLSTEQTTSPTPTVPTTIITTTDATTMITPTTTDVITITTPTTTDATPTTTTDVTTITTPTTTITSTPPASTTPEDTSSNWSYVMPIKCTLIILSLFWFGNWKIYT